MTIKQIKSNLSKIKKIIGWEEFPTEKNELLIQAFIRRSYSQEHPEWQHNQVLELIGDSVLDNYFIRIMCNPKHNNFGSFTNKYQFVSSKNEGELTKIKSNYVNGEELTKHIENLNLSQFLILGGVDEKNNVRNKPSVKEDLFEAILGSIALACDFNSEIINQVCAQMLELNKKQTNREEERINEMRTIVGKNISTENAISKLIELHQKGYISNVDFSYDDELYGDDGNPIWKCNAKLKEYDHFWYSKQSSKKLAKQNAAYSLLKYEILKYPENS